MKRILIATLLALAASSIQAQTSIHSVPGVFNDSSGSLVGAKNFLTGREELFDLSTFAGTLSPAKGGTGVANNAAATFTRSGNHALTLTTTGTTVVTLPTTGTLAILGANTFTAAQTAPSFIPNAATVPTNGMFLSAANMLGFATNGVERWDINSSGAFLPTLDATYDLGGATKPRDVYATRNVIAGAVGAGIVPTSLLHAFVNTNSSDYTMGQFHYAADENFPRMANFSYMMRLQGTTTDVTAVKFQWGRQFFNSSHDNSFFQISQRDNAGDLQNIIKSDAAANVTLAIAGIQTTVAGTLAVTQGGSTNKAVCWKAAGALGYCSTVVAADGSCTCN